MSSRSSMASKWTVDTSPHPTTAAVRFINSSSSGRPAARSSVLDALGLEQIGEGLPGLGEQVRTGEAAQLVRLAQVRLEGEETLEAVVAQGPDGLGHLTVAPTG